MLLILLVCAVSAAWLVVVLAWARRQRIDLSSKVSDIERALEAQEEALKELGTASENFSESVENALRKLGAEDNLESGETTVAVDPIDESTIETWGPGSWKIPPHLVEHPVTAGWAHAKSGTFVVWLRNQLRRDPTKTYLIESDFVLQGVYESGVKSSIAFREPRSAKTLGLDQPDEPELLWVSSWIESSHSRRPTKSKAARKRALELSQALS